MSEGMNRVTLLGNLGADPELRRSGDGLAILNFRMATTERWLDKNKEKQEKTEWHRVVVFGSRAEGLSKVLTKGMCVVVEGNLRTSSYEKDGVTRYSTEIHARDIYLTPRRSLDSAFDPRFARPVANGGSSASSTLGEELPF